MPHIHKLIDFTVSAFITYKRKVLLVDHKKLQTWTPVGGHIELDEDPEEALFREIWEESGLTTKDLILISDTKKPPIKDHRVKPLHSPTFWTFMNLTLNINTLE